MKNNKNNAKFFVPVAIALLFVLPKISEAETNLISPTSFINSTATLGTSSSSTNMSATNSMDYSPNMDNLSKELYTNSDGLAIVTPFQITNEDDLRVYEANLSILNPNVNEVSIETDENGVPVISLQYEHPGTFLGFLPVDFKSTTEINRNEGGTPQVNTKLSALSSLVGDKRFNPKTLDIMLLSDPNVVGNMTNNSTFTQQAQIALAGIKALDMYYEMYENDNATSTASGY